MTTTDWLTDRIDTDGIHMHIYRTSEEEPRLILLHGLTDNGLCWLRVMNALCDDYSLLMPDARGHGLSDKPETAYSAVENASDVVGLIDAMKLDKPILIGHSMGAETAAHVAYKYPNLIRAIVLEDPPWRDGQFPEDQARFMNEWREHLRQQQATMTQDDLVNMGIRDLPKWDEIEFEHWAEATLQLSLNVLDYIVGERVEWRELCANIQCPTLLLTGDTELGAIVSPEIADEALNLLTDAQHVHISGAGHNIRREQFETYMDALRNFLGVVMK